MYKSKTAQGYILSHKQVPFGIWCDELYTPLEVGAFKNERPLFFGCPRDNEGDNISKWNRVYCEQTGVYEIWKNLLSEETEYVGVMQYRRRLKFVDQAEVEKIFEDYDVIMPDHLDMNPYEQYAHCHNRGDMELAEKIINENYPELKDAFDAYIKRGRILYYSSSYVMRKEDFNAWCTFFFGFCEEFLKRKGWDSVERAQQDIKKEMDLGIRRSTRGLDYQSEVFGFLAERLLTMWVMVKFKNRYEMPYTKFDGV